MYWGGRGGRRDGRRWRGGGGGGGGNPMLYALAVQTLYQFLQQENRPPVTIGLIAANAAIYLRPGELDRLLPSTHDVCLNPSAVLANLDVKRLLLSAFYHHDDHHIVYNMISLLWKGAQLEGMLGSKQFVKTVATLLVLSHSILVGLAFLLSSVFPEFSGEYYDVCAIGFSSVLFAMKVLLTWRAPSTNLTQVYGIVVPTRYASWVELLVIQMLVPNASFLGHLAGILAGIVYVNLPGDSFGVGSARRRGYRRPSRLGLGVLWDFFSVGRNPFFKLLAAVGGGVGWVLGGRWLRRLWGGGGDGDGHGRRGGDAEGRGGAPEDRGIEGGRHRVDDRQWEVGGRVVGRRPVEEERRPRTWGRDGEWAADEGDLLAGVWSCGACTYDNWVGLTECEMCGTARPTGEFDHPPSGGDEGDSGISRVDHPSRGDGGSGTRRITSDDRSGPRSVDEGRPTRPGTDSAANPSASPASQGRTTTTREAGLDIEELRRLRLARFQAEERRRSNR
ncbi:hypothetical protein CBR_g40142 [Chara braunii]|uniref:RanBP2-type domain-containing protein n=1 Tax=Chara braunii TaxID=69332 RepID=A0A388LTE0_CHABU|nr:hypothetical protein CBR_g40142 [Chara braunii]|eukprot:GBG85503.1 hypothetical protein CBR_g40142 [Chara braunii]